jgi:Spy/CpxP family protein refolding chaperone
MVLFGSGGKKARLVGTALLVVTFVAGALAGAAVVRVVAAERPEARTPGEPRSMRGGPRKLLLDDEFAKTLGLTEQQRTEIRAILDRRDVEARQMWSSFEPRLKQFGKAVHDDIQKVLTTEQQKKLDAAIEQRRDKWRHRCRGDSIKAPFEEKRP